MADVLRRYTRKIIEDAGLQPGTDLEDLVSYRLYRAGHTFVQQFAVGRYRLDFAWPAIKVAVEADGWFHHSPEGAAKDAERDAWLRSEGWLVLRVDDRHGLESLEGQISNVCRLVHLILDDSGWSR
jgi:very-short-patch-repair endonuclease